MEDACPATIDDDFGPESNSLRCISSGEANAEVQQYTQINMDDIVDVQGGHHCFSANTEDSLMDGKVGELVDSGIHHLQDSHVQFYGLDEISVEVEGANSGESSTNSGESSIIQESRLPVSYEAKMEKCLSKSATFPSSGLEFSHSFCVEENVHSPSTTSSSQDVSLDQLSPYKRSVSLPARFFGRRCVNCSYSTQLRMVAVSCDLPGGCCFAEKSHYCFQRSCSSGNSERLHSVPSKTALMQDFSKQKLNILLGIDVGPSRIIHFTSERLESCRTSPSRN